MGNISIIFPFCGFTAGTILFLLWFVSSTLYLLLNRSDAWNDDVPVLSQALKLLELNTVKFAQCLGERAAVQSDLNVQKVIIQIRAKKKNISAFRNKEKEYWYFKRKYIFRPLYLSTGFCTLC